MEISKKEARDVDRITCTSETRPPVDSDEQSGQHNSEQWSLAPPGSDWDTAAPCCNFYSDQWIEILIQCLIYIFPPALWRTSSCQAERIPPLPPPPPKKKNQKISFPFSFYCPVLYLAVKKKRRILKILLSGPVIQFVVLTGRRYQSSWLHHSVLLPNSIFTVRNLC